MKSSTIQPTTLPRLGRPPREMDADGNLPCFDCNRFLPFSSYTTDTYRRHGVTSYCRTCAADRAKVKHGKMTPHELAAWERTQADRCAARAPSETQKRWCNCCRSWLDKIMFTRDVQRDGLSRYCRSCNNQRNQLYRERHPDRVAESARRIRAKPETKAYQKAYHQRRKDAISRGIRYDG